MNNEQQPAKPGGFFGSGEGTPGFIGTDAENCLNCGQPRFRHFGVECPNFSGGIKSFHYVPADKLDMISEAFADNGEHSHYEIIGPGGSEAKRWPEDPRRK